MPEISSEAVKDQIPIRLSDPDMQAELQKMSVDPLAYESDSDSDNN